MTSKAQRDSGYKLPEEIDGYDLLCVELKIPNNLQYIAAFTAQMWELATWFNWEKSYQPGDTRATEAAQYWNYLIDTYLCIRFNRPVEDNGMACCDDENVMGRFNEAGIWETSTDGGETWEENPDDDPRNTYIGAPPLPGSPGDALKCAAADNVRDLFTQYRDSLIDYLEAGTPLIALIAGILAFIAAITGVSGVAIGLSVLMLGLASQLLALTPESVAEQIDATVLEEFKCLVYCRLEDNGQITYTNWVLLLEDIAATFDGFPETFFYSTVAGMGYIGISNAGTIGAATADDCGDCDCEEDYCNSVYDVLSPIHGIIMERGDDYIIAEATDGGNGTGYIILTSETLGACCQFIGVETISGTYNNGFRQSCGQPYSEPAWTAPLNIGCWQHIQLQAVVGSVLKIFFAPCE